MKTILKIKKFCRKCDVEIQCVQIGRFIRCLRCGNIVQIINGECRTDSLGRVSSTPEIPEIKTAYQLMQEQKQ
jgi:hypothetical protein